MARRKPQPKSKGRTGGKPRGVSVRQISGGTGWVLTHPRCVRDRAEDIAEVRLMIEAGEYDVAVDELRWLLAGCSEFLEAHQLLGALALNAGPDVPLARGHFGAAYQFGLQALRRAKMPNPLPASQPANGPFFAAGQGLAWCLQEMGKTQLAAEVVDTLVKLDPDDPLELSTMLDTMRRQGLPVVDLLREFPLQNSPHEDQ